MRQVILLLTFFFLTGTCMVAQSYTPYQLCTPGVDGQSKGRGLSIIYSSMPSQQIFVPDESTLANKGQWKSNDQLQFKLKIPLMLKREFKLILGLTHVDEEFHVFPDLFVPTEEREFGDQHFRQNRMNLLALKPLNHKHYLVLRTDVNFNGNYNSTFTLDREYMSYRIAGLFGIKKSSSLEYGFGVAFNHGLDRDAVYPFIIYNQTFNKRWGLETVLPVKVKARYNLDNNSMFLLGFSYQSANYRMNGMDAFGQEVAYLYERRGVDIELDYERQLKGWTWVAVTAGYHVPFRNGLEVDRLGENIRTDYTAGPYLRMAFFLSPTAKCKVK